MRCGESEFRFIERSGLYFGLLLGFIQAAIVVLWFYSLTMDMLTMTMLTMAMLTTAMLTTAMLTIVPAPRSSDTSHPKPSSHRAAAS